MSIAAKKLKQLEQEFAQLQTQILAYQGAIQALKLVVKEEEDESSTVPGSEELPN